MTNPARIRAINIGQLATATDRLLVLGLAKRANLARGSSPNIERPVTQTIVVAPLPVRHRQTKRFALAAAIAFGIVLGFATTRIAIAAPQHTVRVHAE